MVRTLTKIWTESEKAAWRLPEKITVSQWADRHRVLDSRTSAEPGPWRTDRTPYLRGIMDCFTDPEVEEITVVKPPQSGGTESLYNMLGNCISEDPSPALLVMPRDEDCDYAVENRLRPMVQASSELSSHTTGRSWDLSKREFFFDRMTLYFAGSNSPAGLGTKPIRYLFLDETDKYPPFAGKEANPIDLATKRTITFWDRKIVKISTPTTATGHITISYKRSNMQRYYLPCIHCGEYRTWKHVQLKVPKTLRDPDEIREKQDVWYECEVCGYKFREEVKEKLVAAGIWLPEGQTIAPDGNVHGLAKRSKRRSGFSYSAHISPWVSWSEIMAQWFEANTEEGIAIGKLMDFKNAILAEPFEETGRKIKSSQLHKLKGGFNKATVPPETLVLVAGCDYHKSKARGIVRIDYEVRGFGYGMRNWVITTGSVPSFDKLDEEILLSPFPWADGMSNEEKPYLAVMVMFIDSGYEPDDVYEYCRQRPGFTIPTKGEPGPRLKPLQPSDLETATEYRLRHKKVRYRGMQLMIVDTFYFKNQVTSWVEGRRDENDKIIAKTLTSFYDEIPYYYFTEFTNEQKIKVRDTRGNARWLWKLVGTGVPTHSLDTAVLCAAAGFYKGVHYLKRPGEKRIKPAAAKKKKITLSELQRRRRMR